MICSDSSVFVTKERKRLHLPKLKASGKSIQQISVFSHQVLHFAMNSRTALLVLVASELIDTFIFF